MKQALIKLHWFFSSQIGIDPVRFIRSLKGLAYYISDVRAFKKSYRGEFKYLPCLNDRGSESGAIKNEYFWQDLTVSRMVQKANPKRHVDIGSRVDGFVAHVASFREIEVFDVRKNTAEVPGVMFRTVDFSDTEKVNELMTGNQGGYCDSVSCLHALEHFGLGRYGDLIDVQGHEKGIKNIAMLLCPGGTLYLSTPVGRERVEFNANRVFDPDTIIHCAMLSSLELSKMFIISNQKGAEEIMVTKHALDEIAKKHYSLALFVFKKF